MRKLLPALFCLFTVSCGGLPPAQVSTDVTIGVNSAMCVLATYSADRAAGKSEANAVLDAATKCGLSLVEATGLLDQAKAMHIRDNDSDAGSE